MQTDMKRLTVAEEKIRDAIEVIRQQGVGLGMSVSEAKALDLLVTAHSLIKEVIK